MTFHRNYAMAPLFALLAASAVAAHLPVPFSGGAEPATASAQDTATSVGYIIDVTGKRVRVVGAPFYPDPDRSPDLVGR